MKDGDIVSKIGAEEAEILKLFELGTGIAKIVLELGTDMAEIVLKLTYGDITQIRDWAR